MVGVRRRLGLVSARKAVGHTQESLAEALNVDRSTVIRWEAGDHSPLPYLWPRLAKVLGRSPEELLELIEVRAVEPLDDLGAAFGWLDRHAGWQAGTARRRAASVPVAPHSNPQLGRQAVAAALAEYYGAPGAGNVLYKARWGCAVAETSILTQLEWLDLACVLDSVGDRVAVARDDRSSHRGFDVGAAVRRLSAAADQGTRISDVPIYRLLGVDVRREAVVGEVVPAPFVEYALGMDLLERELVETLTSGRAAQRGRMPLRDRYLPDLAAVLNLRERFCAGGVLALTAIARPADPVRGGADYLLLVQERSTQVVNAACRLAVIPKSFHGPIADPRADARIGATLRREMEEELFGRIDVDRTTGVQRAADPMHPGRLSAPMRWLTERPGRLRMECTGFGFNLVSGNYEFASLVVIEDEQFWPRFGGDVEANWEATGLRQYSTRDGDLLAELVEDENWSNEGLFAFVQGLRRLSEIDSERVDFVR